MFKRLAKSKFVLGGAVGAALAYFFDPDRGRGRRTTTRDRIGGMVRSAQRRGERAGRRVSSDAQGVVERMKHREPERMFVEDKTLADRIRSELFGKEWFPKDSVTVDVENGVVFLRGQLKRPEDIGTVEDAVRKVPGVTDVTNLLHTAGSPAPNKAEAQEASRFAAGS